MALKDFDNLSNALKDAPHMRTPIESIFRNTNFISTMYKLTQNYDLYQRFAHLRCYPDTDILLTKELSEIVIFVEQLDLYFLATHAEYTALAEKLVIECDPEIIRTPMDIYQVVPATDKQKVVFVCSDNKNLIDDLIKEIYCITKSEILQQQNKNFIEVTLVDIVKNNIDEALKFVVEIRGKVMRRNRKLYELIKQIEIHSTMSGLQYIKYNITESIKCDNKHPVDKILKTINAELEIYNMQKNYHHTQDKKLLVQNWVKNNPFEGEIDQLKYRKKFLDDTKVDIKAITWGKHASELLRAINGGSKRVYVMKNPI